MTAAADTPILENEHVSALLVLLDEGKAKAPELADIVRLFAAVEGDLNKTIASLQSDIAAIRKEAAHPLKTAWENAAGGLMTRLKGLWAALVNIKNRIVAACKQAVEVCKTRGTLALQDTVEVLNIRRDLAQWRDDIQGCLRCNEGQIAKVDTVSAEIHAASRHAKNIARVLTGHAPIPDVKPNGRLARLAASPYRLQTNSLNRTLGRVNQMLERLDHLEKAAEAARRQDRPSTLGNMKRLGAQVRRRKEEKPAEVKGRDAEAELS